MPDRAVLRARQVDPRPPRLVVLDRQAFQDGRACDSAARSTRTRPSRPASGRRSGGRARRPGARPTRRSPRPPGAGSRRAGRSRVSSFETCRTCASAAGARDRPGAGADHLLRRTAVRVAQGQRDLVLGVRAQVEEAAGMLVLPVEDGARAAALAGRDAPQGHGVAPGVLARGAIADRDDPVRGCRLPRSSTRSPG